MTDGALTDTATLTLGPVAPVNDAPVATDDGVVPVVEDTLVSGNVLPNDSDVDGDPLSVTQFVIAGDPAVYAAGDTSVIPGVGTLTIGSDGSYTFTPDLNYNGPVPVTTVTVTDGALTDTSTLTLGPVTLVNDAPVANDDVAPVTEDAPTTGNVLPNDSDVDADTLAVTQFVIAGDPAVYTAGSTAVIPGVGTLTIAPNGAFTFIPDLNYNGPVPDVTYMVSDGTLIDLGHLILGPVTPDNDENFPGSGIPFETETEADGGQLELDGIVDATSNELTPLGGIASIDLADGAVAAAVRGIGGLHRLGSIGEEGVIAGAAAGMDAWRENRVQDGFDVPMFLGGSASLSFGGGGLMIDTVVENGLVYIYAADLSGAPDGHGRTEFRVTMEDGRALPNWLKHAGNGVLVASQSADAGIIHLRIYAVRGDGSVIEDLILVNIADGQLTRADITHSVEGGGRFSDQLGRAHPGRGGDMPSLMHALSPQGGR